MFPRFRESGGQQVHTEAKEQLNDMSKIHNRILKCFKMFYFEVRLICLDAKGCVAELRRFGNY